MVGGGAAARGGERVAEGIIAKAAASTLRDAVGASGRDAARAAARDSAERVSTHAGEDVAQRVGTDAASDAGRDAAADATHHVDLDALPDYHDGGQPDLFGASNVPDDYRPYGELDRQEFYDRHYNDTEGHWDYPPDDGFAGTPAPNTLQTGDVIDRYGFPSGKYTSPVDTPFDERALPPTNLTQPYYRYEVTQPLPPSVTEGRIAPAFEQPGGGVQHYFDKPVDWYLEHGYLRQVYP